MNVTLLCDTDGVNNTSFVKWEKNGLNRFGRLMGALWTKLASCAGLLMTKKLLFGGRGVVLTACYSFKQMNKWLK